ncbi:MAG: hypothetical protein QM610_09600 [Chitinophagaceae bacterium]
MKRKRMYLTVLLLPLMLGCKKEVETLPQPDENGYIWLKNVESLSLIKQTLRGDWKIHYAYGGITGHYKVELGDSYFRYLPNDSIYMVSEGNTSIATKANWIRKQSVFGFEVWMLESVELYPSMLYKDSLSLGENHVEPMSYIMTKIK